MSDDAKELAELLSKSSNEKAKKIRKRADSTYNGDDEPSDDFDGNVCQWATPDGKTFVAASYTVDNLPPGCFEIQIAPSGNLVFVNIPVKTEELIRFPDSNSDKVIEEIRTFWKKKPIFKKHGIPFKRGIILWGPAGCHAKGTSVLMYDGSSKLVEDITINDKLMGPDSKPRNVLDIRRGSDEMFEITPNKGESFIVNGHHIMSLQKSGDRDKNFPGTLNISVNDFLKMSVCAQQRFKLWKTPVVFKETTGKPLVDPYFLGLWLGDGTSSSPAITNMDPEIELAIFEEANKRGLDVNVHKTTNSLAKCYTLTGRGNRENTMRSDLRALKLFDNKHIPQGYMVASEQDRLSLLAGFIDTDGHYSTVAYRAGDKASKTGHKGYFDVIQVDEKMARQFVQLASSLGFGTNIKKCQKAIKTRNFVGDYWRISIFGDISRIPVRLPRKKAQVGVPNKDPLRTGIKSVISKGIGDYYGFTLSGDHLYLTSDYFVQHNSGKSSTVQFVMKEIIENEGLVIKFTEPRTFLTGMRMLRQIQPKTSVVVVMEDIDAILEMYNESDVLNLLDGLDQVENIIFLATTNFPERLGARVINRPSRFDKRFKIPYPSAEARRIYFNKLFKEVDLKEVGVDIEQWVEDSEDFSIAHMKELFVAVFILGDDYEHAIETLKSMNEKISSDQDQSEMPIGFGSKK